MSLRRDFMSLENDGIAYLMALRRGAGAAGPGTGAASASVGAATSDSTETHQGSEKRRSPRYKCEGGVEMCEANCNVRTWATFTDISLHGCYVEAQATYPVGTVLRVKLEAKGRRIEATGNVRVSYPYLGMGISFVEMTEESREQLKELLLSLSQPSVIMGSGARTPVPPAGRSEGMPAVADAQSALRALTDFFEGHQILMREDFLRIVRQSQPGDARR